jgi:hypothetical protein
LFFFNGIAAIGSRLLGMTVETGLRTVMRDAPRRGAWRNAAVHGQAGMVCPGPAIAAGQRSAAGPAIFSRIKRLKMKAFGNRIFECRADFGQDRQ